MPATKKKSQSPIEYFEKYATPTPAKTEQMIQILIELKERAEVLASTCEEAIGVVEDYRDEEDRDQRAEHKENAEALFEQLVENLTDVAEATVESILSS